MGSASGTTVGEGRNDSGDSVSEDGSVQGEHWTDFYPTPRELAIFTQLPQQGMVSLLLQTFKQEHLGKEIGSDVGPLPG